MTYQPTGAKLLCRPIEVESHYPGSVIELLPERLEAETAQQAEIVAVGPGERDEDGDLIPVDPNLKPGVWIMHEPFRRVAVDDANLFLIHERDVVAILDA